MKQSVCLSLILQFGLVNQDSIARLTRHAPASTKTNQPTTNRPNRQTHPPPGALFLVLYGVTAAYFSGVMVRLMLVLAPAACCLAGVAVSDILTTLSCSLKADGPVEQASGATDADDSGVVSKPEKAAAAAKAAAARASAGARGGGGAAATAGSREWNPLPKAVAYGGFVGVVTLLVMYTVHCVG
jgi:dolichyl-diphosphooligosaccharide--protein glycosyltransferase